MMDQPSPESQVEFIEKIQRLLDSGSFVATYKYALLISLCNVAVEQGFDDNRAQVVRLTDLGEQFLRLYWTHVRDYPGMNHALRQNTGGPAAILQTVTKARGSAVNPDRADAYASVPEAVLREATQRVRQMPLMKMQTIGREKADPDHPDNFLYPTRVSDGCITLRPGVCACLRRFRALIVSSSQAAWAEYVRRHNPELGAGSDLDAFLFGSDRTAVHALAPALLDLQRGRCFYTGQAIDVTTAHVDHFVPWAKFPVDSPANLVLASRAANLQKSDYLAALPHVAHWRDRNAEHRHVLSELGGTRDDDARVLSIARFTYAQAARIGTLGWLRGRDMQALDGYEPLFA